MTRPVASVLIVGDDATAWLAAAALRRAFKHRDLAVTVLEPGTTADPVVGRWTLPALRGLHSLLGIAEGEVVRTARATYRLGTLHRGWQGERSEYMHAHGEIGQQIGAIPFYKFLFAQALDGKPQRAEHFSLAAAGALSGRFARPMAGSDALTESFTYGFHLEEAGYVECIRAHALSLGIRHVRCAIVEISHVENGDIETVRVADGSTLTADYFIDCSGPTAALIGQCDSGGRENWSQWLPCDRMWSAVVGGVADPPALTITSAREHGWSWQAPLRRASMAGHLYGSAFISDDRALDTLRESVRGSLETPRLKAIAAGRRRAFWSRNCVALGSAAMQLEPLIGADLHFVQLGLATFIEMFPLDAQSRIEAGEYNRLMGEYADALRDFTIAHYRLGGARDGEVWRAARAAPSPDRLSHKLDLLRANGQLKVLDHESFEEVDWAWLALGTGTLPDALDLQTRVLLRGTSLADVAPLRARIEALAATMPPHGEFVERVAMTR